MTSIETTQPESPAVEKSGPSSIEYSGKNGEMFGLWIKNFILSILTLGIYSFWGRVEITKYISQSIQFADGKFDYHATGKQRFIGFLKGIGILAVVLAILGVLSIFTGPEFIVPIVYLLFFVAHPLIMVGSLRFHRAYTSWNNVRFKFNGEVGEYYKIFLKSILLSIVTLGLYLPFFLNQLNRFIRSNTSLGDADLEYDCDDWEYAKTVYIGYLLTFLTLGIYNFWFTANLVRLETQSTSFQGHRFSSNLTGGEWLIAMLKGYGILIITLGFGFPIFINIIWDTLLSSFSYEGVPNLTEITGSMDKGASAVSDGISEAGDALEAIGEVFG